MAECSVIVRRQVVEELYVDVEAKDEKDAEAKAMEHVEEWIERVIASEER